MATRTRTLTRRALLSQAGLLVLGLAGACRSQSTPTAPLEIGTPSPYPSSTPKATATAQPSPKADTPVATTTTMSITVDTIDSCFSRYAEGQATDYAEIYGINLDIRRAASWRAYTRIIPQGAAAGTLDVVETVLGFMTKAWARFGYLQPLDPLLNQGESSLGDIFPGALEGCTVAGSLYGLPYAASPGECLLGYHPEWFDELGLTYPADSWTLNDLAKAAQALNMVDSLGHLNRYGFVPAYALPGELTILRAFGVELFNPTTNQAASPEAILQLLQWYDAQLHQLQVFPKPYELPSAPLTLFVKDKAAMLQISFGTLVNITGLQEIDSLLFPRESLDIGHGGYISGLAFGVAKSSPRPAESIKWCQYINSAANGVAMLEQGCGVPGCRRSSWTNRAVRQLYPISSACADLANTAAPEAVPANLRQQELYSTWLSTTEPFWQGQLSLESCADLISTNIQHILDKPGLSSTELGG